jgi:hypothetical protein
MWLAAEEFVDDASNRREVICLGREVSYGR